MTRSPLPALCGVVLHPAGHTLSPALHTEAYRQLGLDASYAVFDVKPEALGPAVTGMRALGIRQLSVSIPHKEAVLGLADATSDAARAIGAANTLTLVDGALRADNTDWIGVERALRPHALPAGARALVLGAGGAARAVVYALRGAGLEVAICGRTPARVERVASDLGARAVASPGDAGDWDLLVNATPVGMAPDEDGIPLDADALRPGATVFDTVYRPLETRLLAEARARRCAVQEGLEMLVHQAVEQVRLWSGLEPDAAGMRRAGEAALG